MNIKMAGFRFLSSLHVLVLWTKVESALEGLTKYSNASFAFKKEYCLIIKILSMLSKININGMYKYCSYYL